MKFFIIALCLGLANASFYGNQEGNSARAGMGGYAVGAQQGGGEDSDFHHEHEHEETRYHSRPNYPSYPYGSSYPLGPSYHSGPSYPSYPSEPSYPYGSSYDPSMHMGNTYGSQIGNSAFAGDGGIAYGARQGY